MGVDTPPSLLEKEANRDIARCASLLQRGHTAPSLDCDIGRSISNFVLQSWHQYS